MSLPITLTLPNDLSYLALLNAFLLDLALRTGFSEPEALKIQLCAEETFANIVEHDFPAGAIEPVTIVWEAQTLGMCLRFRHKGQPFDPALFPQLNKATIATEEVQGLGTFLMKQLMDEVQYNNLGHGGQEVVLIKHLDTPRESAPAPAEAPAPAPAAPVRYHVRPLELEESVEVARLAYHAYSYSYPYEHIYFPDRVKKLNADGQLASFVAVTEAGEIIAHAATVYDPGWPGVAELGVAFTKSQYRGIGCLNQLFNAMVEAARAKGDYGLFVTGVTTHPYSQKSAHKLGLGECALMLSKVPSIRFQHIDDAQAQRENLMLFFGFLEPRAPFALYAPPHHRAMLEKLYAGLGCAPRFEPTPALALADGPSRLAITTSPGSLYGVIKVAAAGRNVVQEVHLALRRLCISRIETIYLELDLADPATAALCREFESLGFFFSGLLPQPDAHDVLVLQYLNNQQPDYEAICVASALGEELLAYVRSQDATHALIRG